jgi:hypothetical protein
MWQACVRLALNQEGLITLDQALALGCSADSFQRHVARGDLERILPEVYRLAGAVESPRQKLRAVGLWGGEGTAASHTSAAALIGLKGFSLAEELHAVTTRGVYRIPDWVHVHHLTSIRPGTRSIRGIATTPPWITLIDLGSVAPAEEVRRALDEALFRGIVSLPQMRWALATFGRERHRGTAVLRELLAERGSGFAPPESEGEAMFYDLIETSDLPPGVRQFPVWDGKHWRRLDYAWPGPAVDAEFDGWETHGTRQAFQADRERDRRLQNRGWRVLHYTAEDVRVRPSEVLAEIAHAVLLRNRAQRGN